MSKFVRQHLAITNIAALKELLTTHRISFDRWGEGDSNSIERLFKEYEEGETAFSITKKGKGQLLRLTSRSKALILTECSTGGRKYLKEARRVYANGTDIALVRSHSMSEKRQCFQGHKETPLACLHRGLREELGLSVDDCDIVFPGRKSSIKENNPAYPGLAVESDNYHYAVLLSPHQVSRIRLVEDVPGKATTYWDWVPYLGPSK